MKLRVPLGIGGKVLILAERVRKKDAPGIFYKSTMENRSFFREDQVYVIRKRTKINDIFYYWLSH